MFILVNVEAHRSGVLTPNPKSYVSSDDDLFRLLVQACCPHLARWNGHWSGTTTSCTPGCQHSEPRNTELTQLLCATLSLMVEPYGTHDSSWAVVPMASTAGRCGIRKNVAPTSSFRPKDMMLLP